MPKEAPIQSRRRSRLTPQRREMQILDAAAEVFRDQGYNEALTADIARRAGVVEGTLYRYFPTKRQLMIRVVERWYARIQADYDQQLRGIAGVRARLRYLIWRHLTVIHTEPQMVRLIFNQLRLWPEYRRTAVFALTRAYTLRTQAILQQGVDSGELRDDVALRVVRDMIYGGVEHHTWAYLRGEGEFSVDRAADAMTELVYNGLRRWPAATQDAEPTLQRLQQLTERLERTLNRRRARRSN